MKLLQVVCLIYIEIIEYILFFFISLFKMNEEEYNWLPTFLNPHNVTTL